MAIGDILEFGTLRWYNNDGTYYDVKQYPSYYRSVPNYSSFTFATIQHCGKLGNKKWC